MADTVTLTFGPTEADPLYDAQVLNLTGTVVTTAANLGANCKVQFDIDQFDTDSVHVGLEPVDPTASTVVAATVGGNPQQGVATLQAFVRSSDTSITLTGNSTNPAPTSVVPAQYTVQSSQALINTLVDGYFTPPAVDGNPAQGTSFPPLSYYMGTLATPPVQIAEQMFSRFFLTPLNVDQSKASSLANATLLSDVIITDANGNALPATSLIDDAAHHKKILISDTAGNFPVVYFSPKANTPFTATVWVESSGDVIPVGDLIVVDLTKSTDPVDMYNPIIIGMEGSEYTIPSDTNGQVPVNVPKASGKAGFTVGGRIYLFVNDKFANKFEVQSIFTDFPPATTPNIEFPANMLKVPATQNAPKEWNTVAYFYVDVQGGIHVGPPISFQVAYGATTPYIHPDPNGNPLIPPPTIPAAADTGQVTPEDCYDGLEVDVSWGGSFLDGKLGANDVLQVTLFLNGFMPNSDAIQPGTAPSLRAQPLTAAQVTAKKTSVTFPYNTLGAYAAQLSTGQLGTIEAQYSVYSSSTGSIVGQLSLGSDPLPFASVTVGSQQDIALMRRASSKVKKAAKKA